MDVLLLEDRVKDLSDVYLDLYIIFVQSSLGLIWNLLLDVFIFLIDFKDVLEIKCGVLFCLYSLYDFIGFLLFVILVGKFIFCDIIQL